MIVDSPTQIRVTAPASVVVGKVDVTVTSGAFTSAANGAANDYTYSATTPVVTTVQIDAALDNSDLGKTNSGLNRQRLNQEARFHHHNRGHAMAALGPQGSGDSKSGGGPSVLSGGSARLVRYSPGERDLHAEAGLRVPRVHVQLHGT